jgi:putative transposase
MDKQQEYHRRRKAMRLWVKQIKVREILPRVKRSRSWFKKWKQRFQDEGWAGLKSHSQAPQRPATVYGVQAREPVVRARHRLARRTVGLIGAKAIQRELEESGGSKTQIPSRATVYRILAERGGTSDAPATEPYFPQPHPRANYDVQQMDWTARYLEGGEKVFAFHTISLTTRALHQTIATDKSTATVRHHLLQSWQHSGVPAGLQMDNDAAFCGGYRVERVFGACVRLCLYVGVEPIFIPVREAKRNGVVERLNGLWAQSFWRRNRLRSLAHVRRAPPRFCRWYTSPYLPPRSQALPPSRCLTAEDLALIPADLPITAGRVHFLRRVEADGTIPLLNERWRVGRRWAGQYVWATVLTHDQRLRSYYRASAHGAVRLLKEFTYAMHEPVLPLTERFRQTLRRRKMDTML